MLAGLIRIRVELRSFHCFESGSVWKKGSLRVDLLLAFGFVLRQDTGGDWALEAGALVLADGELL